jgi:hypothetical protein
MGRGSTVALILVVCSAVTVSLGEASQRLARRARFSLLLPVKISICVKKGCWCLFRLLCSGCCSSCCVGVVFRLLCSGYCVQVVVFRLLCSGCCVQVVVFRLLCSGCCVQVVVFGLLCSGWSWVGVELALGWRWRWVGVVVSLW